MTVADEDTNSILPENAKRAIQGNVKMQVAPPDGQLWNQRKWPATWWPNLQLMQVVPPEN